MTAQHAATQECHICLEELRQRLVASPCGHIFHDACILQALQVSNQCPICRRYVQESDVISLYFDVPVEPSPSPSPQKQPLGGGDHHGQGPCDPTLERAHIEKLQTRVGALVERLQWQKSQYDLLIAEMKRIRNQSEKLMLDKQALMQRVGSLESNKTDLVNKVAKYQLELSRQAETTRQLSVNQSIINYLNTCDADAIEDEIQNPRELIVALKKACKFRHDQYQKVVQEKMRLSAMLQNAQSQPPVLGKGKLKAASGSSMDNKRRYPADGGTGFAPHSFELKKRKQDAAAASAGSSMLAGNPSSQLASYSLHPDVGLRAPSSAYSDVAPIRPMGATRPTLGRSSYNTNQYGAYNITPTMGLSSMAESQSLGDHGGAICRRGYDETGKLTHFFLPKEQPKRTSSKPTPSPLQKPMPSMQHILNMQPPPSSSSNGVNPSRGATSSDRRAYALTNWLRQDP